MLWQWRTINPYFSVSIYKEFFCCFKCMWYYINLCRSANVLHSARAQSLLHLAQLRREGRKPVSFCCGFESVYVKAVWGVSVETLRIAASYTSSKGVDDVWYHALPTLLHLQQTLCCEQRRCNVGNVLLKWKCTLGSSVLTARGAEGWVPKCKYIKHKSWFCFSDTFFPWTPVTYHSLHSLPLSCCRTWDPHLTLPFSLQW